MSSKNRIETGFEKPVHFQGSVPYFNTVSADYLRLYNEDSPGGYAFRVRKQRLLESLDKNGGKLLDVGCGPGVMAQDLLDLGYEFWGVDAAPTMIDECHKNYAHAARAHFAVGDAARIDFPDECFDTVICLGVIDHVKDYELAIKEMLRVLRRGGTLLVAFPNFYSPWAWWRNFVFYPTVRLLRPLYYWLRGRPQPPALSSIAKMHSEESAARLIESHNGKLAGAVYYNFNQFLSPLDEMLPGMTVAVAKKLERHHSGRLRRLGSGFILKARKDQ